ncbi:unnamed protein product [Moneuplotes crassus]|uniref:Uncharacterized protein n=1 Tax=Euplotes crassus TaxID=5936 RepID=A0AAD1Y109_EUPCR|nr:unnamed protein product [Moneuplotes crassus]
MSLSLESIIRIISTITLTTRYLQCLSQRSFKSISSNQTSKSEYRYQEESNVDKITDQSASSCLTS